jgi:hypothetical protein
VSSKENVNLSSYKIDIKTGLPLKYLSDQKEALWEKFHKLYPEGMKRTAFLKRLKDGPFVYREDLGGLCSTCSTYGYDVFNDLENLVIQNIQSQELQVRHYIAKFTCFYLLSYEKYVLFFDIYFLFYKYSKTKYLNYIIIDTSS